MQPEELQIFKAKYASPRIGTLTDEDTSIWADALLLKIQVITGWILPADKAALNILSGQFAMKLKESYANCCPDEIEYAFRKYGSSVENWGKNLNLSLIDQVMTPYLAARETVSALETERVRPEPKNVSQWVYEKEMWEWWQATAQLVKEGNYRLEFIPDPLFEWFQKTPEFVAQNYDMDDFGVRAVKRRRGQLMEERDASHSREAEHALSRLNRMISQGYLTGDERDRVVALRGKLIVWDAMAAGLEIKKKF